VGVVGFQCVGRLFDGKRIPGAGAFAQRSNVPRRVFQEHGHQLVGQIGRTRSVQ
jgi:hypothetical protein